MKKLLTSIAVAASLLAPAVAYAQSATDRFDNLGNGKVKIAILTDMCGPGNIPGGARDKLKDGDLIAYNDLYPALVAQWYTMADLKDKALVASKIKVGKDAFCKSRKSQAGL